MARTWVGTAGWHYDDWDGIVYPPAAAREPGFHPLPYLARSIDIVEINSSFYRPPSPATAASWVKRVRDRPGFLFAAKLHQAFTHQRRDFGRDDVDRFRAGIGPLRDAGRLAALLLQFPWSFAPTPENLGYLVRLFDLFADFPRVLEVRRSDWQDPGVFRLLEENRVAFCNIDQPRFAKCLGPTEVSTTKDFAYVRLHGRNAGNWFRKDAGRDDRYDYLYGRDELEEWVGRIRRLGEGGRNVYVITNNHYRGQAVANALQIKNMITGEKLEVPGLLVDKYPVLADIARRIRAGRRDLFDDPGEEGGGAQGGAAQ